MVSGILLVLAALQDPGAPVFKKFEFARERIEHKVDVDAALAAPAGADLADVQVTAIYYDQDKELRRSKTVRLGKVAAGSTVPFKLVAVQVPNFTRYEVYVEAGGKTRLYVGNEASPFPTLRKAEAAKLTVVSCTAAAAGGAASVVVVVKNTGEIDADEPTAVLSFLDRSGAASKKSHIRLDAKLPAASEDTFEITVPGAPEFDSIQSGICWGGAERMALTDPAPDAKELNLTGVRIVRLTDGWARVAGSVRNGTAVPVDKVVATFKLGKRDAPYSLPGALKPGQTFPFEFYVPDCPPFDDCTFGLGYSEAPASTPGAAAPPSASSRRTGSKKLDVGQAKLPEPLVKQDKPSSDEKPGVRVELRGAMVVEGIYYQQGQARRYTGDTYILKLAFTDENGKAYQPTPTMNFVVYNGQEPYQKSQRIVKKEQWNTDATKIEKKTVASDTIACDKKTGELWVAFVRSDNTSFEPRFDLTLEIRGAGTWIWKGIDRDKKFEAPSRGPDKPAEKK